jgi:hypothetical protein
MAAGCAQVIAGVVFAELATATETVFEVLVENAEEP